MTHKKSAFKNDTTFRTCISKVNNAFIDNAEDLDIVMPMYNLLVHHQLLFDIRKFVQLLQR